LVYGNRYRYIETALGIGIWENKLKTMLAHEVGNLCQQVHQLNVVTKCLSNLGSGKVCLSVRDKQGQVWIEKTTKTDIGQFNMLIAIQ
jgi:hypothetical protein